MPSYWPILKGKRGELSALADLDESIANEIFPLIEVPPIDLVKAPDGGVMRKTTTEAHLAAVVEKLAAKWGPRRFSIDLADAKLPEVLSSGETTLEFLFNRAREAELHVVPVVRLTSSVVVLGAIGRIANRDGRGVVFRARRSEGMSVGWDVDLRCTALMVALGLTLSDCDLLLDGDDLRAEDAAVQALSFATVLNGSSVVPLVRGLAVAATSFPGSLAAYQANTISTRARGEWTMYRALLGMPLTRSPAFADYGISHPAHLDSPPWLMTVPAAIRYTANDHWVILKARGLNRHGYGQFRVLARNLVRHRDYRGRHFSVGDARIDDCAIGADSHGNSEVWRRAGTDHHVTLVVRQVRQLLQFGASSFSP